MPHRTSKRNIEIAHRYKNGETSTSLACDYGISASRIQQILSGKFGLSAEDGGAFQQRQDRLRERASELDRICLERHGCTHKQYRAVRKIGPKLKARGYASPLEAYRQQKRNAVMRGIAWEFDFWTWWNVWRRSGKWLERGRSASEYVMSRKGDIGPYSVDNVEIKTAQENWAEFGCLISVRASTKIKRPKRVPKRLREHLHWAIV